MKIAAAFLLGIVIGGFAVQYTEPYLESGGLRLMNAPQCDAVVRISFDGTDVHAYPDRVCLAKGRNLTWEIDDKTAPVEIDFNIKPKTTGPFPFEPDPKKNPHNKGGRGKYRREANDPNKLNIDSNPADKLGAWKYTVRWFLPDGTYKEKDPAVCIRK